MNEQLSRREFAIRLGLQTGLVLSSTLPALAAEPAATSPWQIGCYTRPWDEHDWRTALDGIAEAGYRGVGLMTARTANNLVISTQTTPEQARQVGEECRRRKLTVLSVYGGGFPIEGTLDAALEGLRKLIDHCAACGGKNLMMGGVDNEQRARLYYQAIKESCDYAAGLGIGLSVKPHGGTNATSPQCRKIIEGVGKPNFRLWYDPGNIFYYSDGRLDPVDDAREAGGLVVGMSVKDYLPPKNVQVAPGAGLVNFRKVMAHLKQGGFTAGPLIVETLPRGGVAQITAEARKARLFLEDLLA